MEQKIKISNSVEDIAKYFDGGIALSGDKSDFYEELFKEEVKQLTMRLSNEQNPKATYYALGQSGSGKTTTLNFIKNDNKLERFDIFTMSVRERIADEDDNVDIVDILLMVGFEIVEKDEELQKKYFKNLQEKYNINRGALEKSKESIDSFEKSAEVKASGGVKVGLYGLINFGIDFFSGYKINDQIKSATREVFKIQIKELSELVNSIILEAKMKSSKEILLIIDDLEKMKDVEQIRKLFLTNRHLLEQIACVKILPIPIFLPTMQTYEAKNLIRLVARITPNKIEKEQDDKKAEENIKRLKELVLKRLSNAKLIDEDALDEAITLSGGNIRQLVTLLQESAFQALFVDEDAKHISKADVLNAKKRLSGNMGMSFMGDSGKLIKLEDTHEILPAEMSEYAPFLQNNVVLAYFNGNPWYDINPLYLDSIKLYAGRK